MTAPGKGIGQLASVSGPNGLSESTSYDTAGRVATIAYPSGQLTVQQVYNSFGYLAELRNAATNALFWQANAYQADGQLTQASYGNGLVNVRSCSATTGLLDTVTTGPVGNQSAIQYLRYYWGSLGNLTRRQDLRQTLEEKFTYDGLNRLTKATLVIVGANNNISQTYSYDSIGNGIKGARLDLFCVRPPACPVVRAFILMACRCISCSADTIASPVSLRRKTTAATCVGWARRSARQNAPCTLTC